MCASTKIPFPYRAVFEMSCRGTPHHEHSYPPPDPTHESGLIMRLDPLQLIINVKYNGTLTHELKPDLECKTVGYILPNLTHVQVNLEFPDH